MRLLCALLLFVAGNQTFACVCEPVGLTGSFISADFVAHIKIVEVYPNQNQDEIYKADIELIELFKGQKLTSIYIRGRSDGKMGSSCSVYFPKGSELVIAANSFGKEKYSFGACSYKINLKKNYRNTRRNIEVLRAISAYDNTLTLRYFPIVSPNFYDFLKSKKGIVLNEKFALFEVVLDGHNNPSQVKMIKGFGIGLDDEIVEELYQSTWEIKYFEEESEVQEKLKVIVPVYFYPEEGEYQSFLSTNSL
ncbi:Tissue inhibitor of metalloproteinase [Algoriphagus locisalis]|uniref:Tissue inhibitor of metalloproteinase n=1 Tax=Algoriphagus locisalis TaxID=305507 RepID=A0A1I7BW68_9BACT|nr:hypothetical protein [Algoriphagus locisalis]SFT91351.1 Tissue inhibitor of metalloproteinase [Algoriphagus locisalis]